MKKILSLLILTSFLFISLVDTYAFTNIGKKEFYYGEIIGQVEKEGDKKKTIYLLQEDNGKIHQIFSSEKSNEIKNLFLNKNNVKILGQKYNNPNNGIYAGIFINKIWNLDIKKNIYKKGYKYNKDTKKITKEELAEQNRLKKISEFKEKFSKLEYVIKNFHYIDEKILAEIKMNSCKDLKEILNKKNLSDSEKFIKNELKNISGIEKFLNLRIKAKEENIDDGPMIKNFIYNSHYNNFNKKNSENKLKNFLANNKPQEILKISQSKDFQSKKFEGFKINFPQNFDYQEISIGNEKFSRIYLKDFYSDILSFNFNKVEKFNNFQNDFIFKEESVKISGYYGKKFQLKDEIFYQIKNKSGEKFEISFPRNEKNFKEIFESILNKIGN